MPEQSHPQPSGWDASDDKHPATPPVLEVGTDRSTPPSLLVKSNDGAQVLRVNRDGAVVAVPHTWRGRIVMRVARLLGVVKPAPDWSRDA